MLPVAAFGPYWSLCGMNNKVQLKQYRGTLSAAEIAYGMSAATRNAARLLVDAELLFKNVFTIF